MRKYLKVFSLGIQEILTYRLNFLFGRLNNLVMILTLYFLWINIFTGDQVFFGFTREKIIAYVLGASILSSVILIQGMNKIAFEIADGDLSNYLVKPISYFRYWFARNNAQRVILLVTSGLEVWLIALFIPGVIFIQTELNILIAFVMAVVLAIILYQILDFLMGISAFWLYKSFGPRWALQTTVWLASGYVFPLDILPDWLQKLLQATPLPYLIHFPLKIYLGLVAAQELLLGFAIVSGWIIVLSFIAQIVWQRGLGVFEGAGR